MTVCCQICGGLKISFRQHVKSCQVGVVVVDVDVVLDNLSIVTIVVAIEVNPSVEALNVVVVAAPVAIIAVVVVEVEVTPSVVEALVVVADAAPVVINPSVVVALVVGVVTIVVDASSTFS